MTTHIKRSHIVGADRYRFDNGQCSYEQGFAQVDTMFDAWYFGIWVNPITGTIVSYMEGDVTVGTTDNDAEFAGVLVRYLKELDREERPARIDVGVLPVTHPMRDKLVGMGLASYLH